MAVLVHVCCAECLLGSPQTLREQRPALYFYNPNIHPLIEFRRRLKAVKLLAEQDGLDLTCDETYGLREFLERVDWRGSDRCRACYRLRLRRAAEEAASRGLEAFTTTLLVSGHQDHEAVRQVGEEVARETGVPLAYFDGRPLAETAHREAKRRSLYCQQYCGCIFSEYDRYKDTGLHVHRPGRSGDGRD